MAQQQNGAPAVDPPPAARRSPQRRHARAQDDVSALDSDGGRMAHPQRWDDMAAAGNDAARDTPSKKTKPATAKTEAARITKLLKGSAKQRADAFATLAAVAKAPKGRVLLEDEWEVSATDIMLPCVHPLLGVMSSPVAPLPPSVNGSVSVLVDEKMATAIAEIKAAPPPTPPPPDQDPEAVRPMTPSLQAVVKSLQRAPKQHDAHWKVKKVENALREDEWHALARAIVGVLPCRICLDPIQNAGGQCQTDCRECARLVRRQKLEFFERCARTHSEQCEAAAATLKLVTAATAIASSQLTEKFSAWASPVGSLQTGLDCPPVQAEKFRLALQPKPKTPAQEGETGDGESKEAASANAGEKGTGGSKQKGAGKSPGGKKKGGKAKGKKGGKGRKSSPNRQRAETVL